ncbi:hypothetical protein HDU93_005020 [Gonapodya sp. JEL0774]|nr:hypothetical protein HDU93_005020 [Gonapodya sp. JEL0774]
MSHYPQIQSSRSRGAFFSYTENALEVSVIADVSIVAEDFPGSGSPLCPGLHIAGEPFRALEIENEYGGISESSGKRILELSAPLARAGISIFFLSTYQTDFVFVKERRLSYVVSTLQRNGLEFVELDSLDLTIDPNTSGRSDAGSVGGRSLSARGSNAFEDAEIVRRVAAMAAKTGRKEGGLSGTSLGEESSGILAAGVHPSIPSNGPLSESGSSPATASSLGHVLATSLPSSPQPIPLTTRRHPSGQTHPSRLRNKRPPNVDHFTRRGSVLDGDDDADEATSASASASGVTDTTGSLPFAYSYKSPTTPSYFTESARRAITAAPAPDIDASKSEHRNHIPWESMLAEVRRETRRHVLSHTLRLVGLNRDYAEWWGVRLVKLIFYPEHGTAGGADRFFSYTATEDGVSVVAEEGVLEEFGEHMVHKPGGQHGAVRCIQVDLEQFGLDRYGIVYSMAEPLTSAGVNLLYLSTYKTANVLVDESDLESAVGILDKLKEESHTQGVLVDRKDPEAEQLQSTSRHSAKEPGEDPDEYQYLDEVTTEHLKL